MTVKKLLLAGITVVSLGGVLFWWLKPPSEPVTGSAVMAPANAVAGSAPGIQLTAQVAMIESLLAEETSARRLIEQRLREIEERLSVDADIERVPGLENKHTAAGTHWSPLSPSVSHSLENRHTDKSQVQADKSPRNLRDALVQTGIDSGTVEKILFRIGENRMALLSMRG